MILDTNALSAFADGLPPVVQHIASADELHVPVIVLGEYRFGIATSPADGSTSVGWRVADHFGTCFPSLKKPLPTMHRYGSN